jgi:hypothetical protein
MDAAAGSLEALLELAARDEASGLPDAPWPPQFAKAAGEAPRVSPSRAKGVPKPPRVKMPVLIIAHSPDKPAALAGLDRWKARHPDVVAHLQSDDVLVDRMRGRSSVWWRVRVNLKNVPEALRPPQETPDPDDDPTRGWREAMKAGIEAFRNADANDPLPQTLSGAVLRALVMSGIVSLGQVAERTEAEMRALPGIGPKAVGQLRDALAASGRSFKPA